MRKGFIICFLLFLYDTSNANNLFELKTDLIIKLEHAQQQYGEEKCCATDEDKGVALSQFDQGSIDFISISMYQKLAHECEVLKTEPETIKIPNFRLNQVEIILTFNCTHKVIGYKNESIIQLLIAPKSDNGFLSIIGHCELQKDGDTRCAYNFFKDKYLEYNQTTCPSYKNNDLYALYQRYQNYKRDNAYPEYFEKEMKVSSKIIHDYLTVDDSQASYDKAIKEAHIVGITMRATDPKYQQELIANQALVLARQYQNKYFVEMDLVYDIEADLKKIRKRMVEADTVMVPLSGVNRKDVRLVDLGSTGTDRIYVKPDRISEFEKELPAEIDCINHFWGFNQFTMYAEKWSWDTDEKPWTFYMTLGGENLFESVHALEYIEHDYFDKTFLMDVLPRSSACDVTERSKLALRKSKDNDQIYIYSSGDMDCPAGCINKYYTFFRSTPTENRVSLEHNPRIARCDNDLDDYRNYFSY